MVDNENKDICALCGSKKSYKFSRLRNKNGNWDGKSYKCETCRSLLKNYGTVDKEKIRQIQDQYKGVKRKSLVRGRVCCVCGRNNTLKRENGKEDWYHKYDNDENWTGRYLCNKCYITEYQERPDSQRNIFKAISKGRTGELSINDNNAFGLIGEAIIAKVRNLEVVSIKLDKFNTTFDLSNDPEFGIIEAKIRNLQKSIGSRIYEFWVLHIDNYYFDHLLILCVRYNKKNIERTYVIPRKDISTTSISIFMNDLKWKKFRIDEKPYNDAYQSLMSFLSDKKYFGIEDIKKWMRLQL